MADLEPPSPSTRRRMLRQRRRDTRPELRLRRELHRRGLRYRLDQAPVPGLRTRADLVFRPARVAVFVDGCFWHGCPEHFTKPANNAKWWRSKIDANRERDERITASLVEAGWEVIRVWEHEDVEQSADRVATVVAARREASSGRS